MYYAITAIVAFVLGLVVHRYILSEAKDVEKHFTHEINELRTEMGMVVPGNGRKMGR